MDPGRLEWYGVVDRRMALFSWAVGEEDIEWYYRMEEGFPLPQTPHRSMTVGITRTRTMVKINRVYTGGGDTGESSLVDGSRRSKG